MADQGEAMSGIYRRPSTRETVVVLDGVVVGGCSMDIPEEAQRAWLRRLPRVLGTADFVKVIVGTVHD